MQERVQKFLSEQGVASRRKAEEFIVSGQVFINGRKAKLGDKVDPQKDVVKVYGKIIKPVAEKIYIALNKPKGYVVTKRDPQNRRTIFSLLPEELRSKVWNVGRLDYDTSGLLLLTNDGDLTQQLAHPKYEHQKEYEIRTDKKATKDQLQELAEGVMIATGLTSPAEARVEGTKVFLTIHEGKKRQVRRMFDSVGLPILSLKRIRIGKLSLGEIQEGKYELVKKSAII